MNPTAVRRTIDLSPVRARKPFLLHVGTHKTGTTSLQVTFTSSDAHLLSCGTLYPVSGRVGHGQHNIAWGLLGDHRFDPTAGYLNELVAEIRHHNPDRVIISSEDLEYLHGRPEQMHYLRRTIRMLGFEPIVVIVLRDPADYAESLYAELARHGLQDDFEHFARTALVKRGVTFKSNWDFRLDYEELVHDFSKVFGCRRVMVLPYDETDMVQTFLKTFPTLVADRTEIRAMSLRLNRRSSSAETSRAIAANRLRADPATAGVPPRPMDEGDLANRNCLRPELRASFATTFGPQIERVVRRHPIRSLEAPIPSVTRISRRFFKGPDVRDLEEQ